MQTTIGITSIFLAVLATAATAQTTVTTSGGGAGTIPVFTGSSDIGLSLINQTTGNVNIGGSLALYPGVLGTTAGNTLPLLSLVNSDANLSQLTITQIRDSNGTGWDTTTTRLQQTVDVTPQGYMDFNPVGGLYGLAFGEGETELLRINGSGEIGIGTTSPGSKLEVNGNIQLTSGSGASIKFQDGTIQSTAWTGTLCGGDYADSVDVSGNRQHYEPGDVLVITSDAKGDVMKSQETYSTMVAGIYSTKPGMVGRRQSGNVNDSTTEIPMAMVGIVPTKVDAENGPIKRGDLLVTSSKAGYAMKGTDRTKMLGAVVGKAMGSLDSGSGMIEVLVTLQ